MDTREKKNFFLKTVDANSVIVLYPFLILIGKIVRWTVMYSTLIVLSKGWGYVTVILNQKVSFSLMGGEDLLNGVSGEDNNMYLMYKLLRFLCLNIPDDFYSFEIAITLVWGFLLFLVLRKLERYITVLELFFISLGVMAISVYSFSLAKEPMQMLYFLAMFWVLYTNKISESHKFFWAAGVILLSAVTFRLYYVLILVFTIALCFFLWLLGKKEGQFSLGTVVGLYAKLVGVYFAIMWVLNTFLGSLYLRMANAILYASDATSSSNTYIENVMTNSTENIFLLAVEYGIMVLRLLFPIELISLGVKYWPYIIFQLCASVMMVMMLRNYHKNTVVQNVALVFYVGFVFASATFEVDFGAWIRHSCVVLPIVLLMTGAVQPKKVE